MRAPSTVGIWLRLFIWATVRQLDRLTRILLARAWAPGWVPTFDAELTIDVDSTEVETYGLQKQGGAKFSYLGVRAGYHPLLASLADTGELLHAPCAGATPPPARAQPASWPRPSPASVSRRPRRADAARGLGVLRRRGGVGVSPRPGCGTRSRPARTPAIRKTIAAIPDDARTPIPYWIDGGADVAETTYTAFAATKYAVPCRLLVRRVRPTSGSQLARDVVFDYHAILTDRDGDLLETEADHRRHAVFEHVVDDQKHHAGLAHLPPNGSPPTPPG